MNVEPSTRGIKAQVGPKVIGNVDRYFHNDIEGIATELLQNARRAGASKVRVRTVTSEGTCTVTDDAKGLPSDGAGLLLTFGGSGNPDAIEHDEAAAGMGFFSLARRGALVRSRDWSLDVSPDVFVGRAEATLTTGLEPVEGMSITFPMQEATSTVQAAFRRVAAPMPFRTTIGTIDVQRFAPRDLLLGPGGEPTFDDMLERIVGDCQVVVARYEDGSMRRRMPGDDDDFPIPMGQVHMVADVFGQVLEIGHGGLAGVIPKTDDFERQVAVRRTWREGNAPAWRFVSPGYAVVLEALGSMTLVPRLPDRRQVVMTEGLASVMQAIASMVAELASRAPRNGVPPGSPLRSRATADGTHIPPCQRVVRDVDWPSAVDGHESTHVSHDVRGLDGQVRVVRDNGVVIWSSSAEGEAPIPFVSTEGLGPLVAELLAGAMHLDPALAKVFVDVGQPRKGDETIVSVDILFQEAEYRFATSGIDDGSVARTVEESFAEVELADAEEDWFDLDDEFGTNVACVSAVLPVDDLTAVFTTSKGRIFRVPVPVAIVPPGDLAPAMALFAPGTTVERVVDAFVNTLEWHDGDDPDDYEAIESKEDVFRDKLTDWVSARMLPPAADIARRIGKALGKLSTDVAGVSIGDVVMDGAGPHRDLVTTMRDGTTHTIRLGA